MARITLAIRLILFYFLFFYFFSCISADEGWSLRLNSEINLENSSSVSGFVAGYDALSSDGLDVFDVAVIEGQECSTPLYSIIDSRRFMVDYRGGLEAGQEKIWDIAQKANEEFIPVSNLKEKITWKLYNVPEHIQLKFIDYGESGNSIVREIDIKSESSYEFDVSNIEGEYRNFKIIASMSESTYSHQGSASSQPSAAGSNQAQQDSGSRQGSNDNDNYEESDGSEIVSSSNSINLNRNTEAAILSEGKSVRLGVSEDSIANLGISKEAAVIGLSVMSLAMIFVLVAVVFSRNPSRRLSAPCQNPCHNQI